ncbi:TPA: hypothetical protein ACNRPM_004152 [Klebsiella pneumoniae]
MFKSLNTDWLKLALLRVFQSGWTVIILVGLSLIFCSFNGRQAFAVWWLSIAGIVLVCASIGMGNLPYRLLQPTRAISKWATVLSWIVWGVGVLLLVIAPVLAKSPLIILLGAVGVLTGFLFSLWVSRKEPFKWIR